jgi:fluoroquinolone resistance protein
MDALERLTRDDRFEGEEFADADVSGVDLSDKDFTGCTFRRVTLPESVWRGVRLEDCEFASCDLARAKPAKLSLRGATFVACRLTGIEWSDLAANPTVSFTECNLQYSSFIDVNLTGTSFRRCRLIETHFVDVRLTEADFAGSDLSGTTFEGCDLTRADFGEAIGLYLEASKNKVKGARISVATAMLMATALGLRISGVDEEPSPPEPSSARRRRLA